MFVALLLFIIFVLCFQHGWTVLIFAAMFNSVEIVELLMNAGADMNHKSNNVCGHITILELTAFR